MNALRATAVRPSGQDHTMKPSQRTLAAATPWLFAAPALVLLLVFLVLPFLMAFGLSFTNQRLVTSEHVGTAWVGARNYLRLFDDESFWAALRRIFVREARRDTRSAWIRFCNNITRVLSFPRWRKPLSTITHCPHQRAQLQFVEVHLDSVLGGRG